MYMDLFPRTRGDIYLSRSIVSIFSALTATGLVLYCTNKLISRPPKKNQEGVVYSKIPVPQGAYYYLGHLPSLCFGDFAPHVISKWHREYGSLINVKMGVQNWVFIGDAGKAQEILANCENSTSGRPATKFSSYITSGGERGLLYNNNPELWRKTRLAAQRALAPRFVQGYKVVFSEQSVYFAEELIKQTYDNGEVDPLPYIRLCNINILRKVIYGAPAFNSPQAPDFNKLVHTIETGMKMIGPLQDISSFLPILSFLGIFFERRVKKFWYNECHPLFSDLARKARADDQDNLTKLFDSFNDEHDGLDEQNLNTLLGEFFLIGSDTVSATTLWTLALLCHYPDTQQKIIEEIDAFIKANYSAPGFEDRLHLPHYIAFQKECLRYRPASFFGIPRKVTKDMVYENYLISKGTILVSSLHTLHMDERYYTEPEKFKPERFLKATQTLYGTSWNKLNEREQFIFGWGKRICPGIAMAEVQLFHNIIQLLMRCTIEPALSSSGDPIYPDLNSLIDKGVAIHPTKFKIRVVTRENCKVL